jgi:hypothetical protein
VVDITNDMRVRLENYLSTLNWALDCAVHNHSLGGDSPCDLGFARDNERSAMDLTLDLPIDLDQTLRSDTAHNLQSFGDNGSTTP